MSYRVHLTHSAEVDVDAILKWLRERSPAGSETWFRRWREVLDSLGNRADACGLAPESEDHPHAIRQVIFKTKQGRPYRVLFAIREDCVFVLHVRGPGQDVVRPEELE
ncbi:MAG: hypothetical protein WD845_08620 [Pirellulales bacterium]